jgi:hypothetical protein
LVVSNTFSDDAKTIEKTSIENSKLEENAAESTEEKSDISTDEIDDSTAGQTSRFPSNSDKESMENEEVSELSDPNNEADPLESINNINLPSEEQEQSGSKDDHKPSESTTLTNEDFHIEISDTRIDLESKYNEQEIPLEEIPLDNHYVGELIVDGFKYKYYMHQFDGITIYTSNALFDKKGRNFDDYVISQITIHDSSISTARGIKVGSTLDEVLEQYGEGKQYTDQNQIYIDYILAEKVVSFVISKEEKIVKEIFIKLMVE